jgi:hypothetical protein
MVSVAGNLYSVPDNTRCRILDIHVFADEIRIFEDAILVAVHAPLEGRDKTHVDPAHRQPSTRSRRCPRDGEPIVIRRTGDQVARRSLDFYQAVGRRLAGQVGAQ